jgi:rhamnogalacturonan endolyase
MAAFSRRRLGVGIAALALVAGSIALGVTQALAATGCRVVYTITNQWTGGFGGTAAVTNLGDPLTSWTLGWTFPAAGQALTQSWDGTYSQSGQNVTIVNASYNGNLATGATVTPGFNGTWTTSNPVPTAFTLNGVACSGSVSGSPTPTTPSPTRTPTASPTPTRTPTTPPTTPPTTSTTTNAPGFGFTNSGGVITVTTGAGLVFKVNNSNGDLTSLKYNGLELQNQSRFSHVESGLGATVTATQSGNYIILTETTHTFYGSGTVLHYMVARSGDNNIYMATYVDAAGAGELRWYQSMNHSALPNTYTPSNTNGGTAIESTDILLVNGQTRSKYYSNRRAMDLTIRGITGNGVGVFMDYGNRESSSGGPFFRDIEQQDTGNTDLYNYLWSGHNDTEAQRTGVLYGPYALMVTNGSTPAAPDLNFMYSFGFQGSVGPSGRGFVSGTESGVTSGNPVTVGWANSTAQYWATPDGSGNFTSPAMKPGTYTETLYQNELGVATRSVTVSAGATTTGQNIASSWSTPSAIFRIGTWDGTPSGFKNSGNLTFMHPSDTRNASWGPATYTVGSSALTDFPSYQWKDVNNPTTVKFTLSSSQVAAHTVRIGITAAYAGGRPQITINGWTSSAPSPSTQPDSRSLTIGTYRGNNALYTYSVPASAFVSGTNTMTITVISGSSGTGYLSPGYSYDAVDLF